MKEPNADQLEKDPRFISGEWRGFFLQPKFYSSRIQMTLCMTFSNGRVTGEGQDLAGKFILREKYETESGDVIIHKRYVHAHDVLYRGFAEQKGKGIWGTWEIPRQDRGGWHLWPQGHGNTEAESLYEENEEPCERIILTDSLIPTTTNID